MDEPPKVIRARIEVHVNRPKSSWQQDRVIHHLGEMYSSGIPDRCSKKQLLRELAKRDPDLEKLDRKTLRRAIEQYNSSRH
jgi:hypothetical protein